MFISTAISLESGTGQPTQMKSTLAGRWDGGILSFFKNYSSIYIQAPLQNNVSRLSTTALLVLVPSYFTFLFGWLFGWFFLIFFYGGG